MDLRYVASEPDCLHPPTLRQIVCSSGPQGHTQAGEGDVGAVQDLRYVASEPDCLDPQADC